MRQSITSLLCGTNLPLSSSSPNVNNEETTPDGMQMLGEREKQSVGQRDIKVFPSTASVYRPLSGDVSLLSLGVICVIYLRRKREDGLLLEIISQTAEESAARSYRGGKMNVWGGER